jgi:hypothetical protein
MLRKPYQKFNIILGRKTEEFVFVLIIVVRVLSHFPQAVQQ